MTRSFILYLLFGFSATAYTQKAIQLGGGNSEGISVSTSSDSKIYEGAYSATGNKTINGEGLVAADMEAVRFLSQATFGPTPELTAYVKEIGIERWIDEQMEMEYTNMVPLVEDIYATCFQIHLDKGGDSLDFPIRPSWYHVDYAWWENMIVGEDLLRQRTAYALSQIMVVSSESNLSGYGPALAAYYDILVDNAFGNYRDLLEGITKNTAMGFYLSHLNNAKTDVENNTNPDENYAREIMQLFSIGLFELNQDGTYKLDGSGNTIPTYNNEDIKEFAKIFTGFGIGERADGEELNFGNSIYIADATVPMKMYDEWHEPGEKHLLNGYVVPEGQTGEEDIDAALDHLFNHENVGPFISKRLIQHFVKSNPTPQYVSDIAGIFNDNGDGVRGDLGAVVKGILMHEEARTCEWMQDATQGKLREPILRYTTFARQFKGESPFYDRYWNISWNFLEATDQFPLHSPTVFNFFSPFYSPNGPIADAGLIGPEFEIHNSRTSINFANQLYIWIEWEGLSYCRWEETPEGSNNYVRTDLTALYEMAREEDALLDYLDLTLCHGQLSQRTREIIKSTIANYPVSASGLYSRVELASYLVLVSPDYNILK